ncbi:hypothetical protein [Bradyrhizobium sp. UNPA324]|uniref:hypothetical protein n=1 Tax=Bradyrhizobium sp. UNPA324 TaxID=1141174 RepID=UPI0015EEE443|nr:hypothetical protein [Bradyrhizobium sp. UNPA324]
MKLVEQPPTQLPVMLAYLASFAESEIGAAKIVPTVVVVGLLTVCRATTCCFAFDLSVGASTVTSGSVVVGCDRAGLPDPRIIKAMQDSGADTRGEKLMATSPYATQPDDTTFR